MTSYASHWVVTISALLSELKVADGILCNSKGQLEDKDYSQI